MSKSLKQVASSEMADKKPSKSKSDEGKQQQQHIFKSASSASFPRHKNKRLATCQSDPGKTTDTMMAGSVSASEMTSVRRRGNNKPLRTIDSSPSLPKIDSNYILNEQPASHSPPFLNDADDMDLYDDDDDDDQTTTTTASSCNYSTPSLMRSLSTNSAERVNKSSRTNNAEAKKQQQVESMYSESEDDDDDDEDVEEEFLNSGDDDNSELEFRAASDQNNNNKNFVNGGEFMKLNKSASTASTAAIQSRLLAKQEETSKNSAHVIFSENTAKLNVIGN